jgi:hypothetical protein
LPFASWHDFYYAEWQHPWALLVVPFAFWVWRALAAPPRAGTAPEAKAFVVAWSGLFAVETMLDPVATGPVAKAIGVPAVSTVLGLAFVLLGDFRIWWLVQRVDRPAGAVLRALAPTVGVPIVAWLVTKAFPSLPGQALWLIHESLFFAVALVVSRRLAGRFERAVLAYAGVYYALWVACDVLILAGVDAGWLLRCVPNQLYYGLTVPFVWWRFFAPAYAATSSSAHASR